MTDVPDEQAVMRDDREAAIAWLRSDDCPIAVKMIISGPHYDALVRAFARHRARSVAAAGARVAAAGQGRPRE